MEIRILPRRALPAWSTGCNEITVPVTAGRTLFFRVEKYEPEGSFRAEQERQSLSEVDQRDADFVPTRRNSGSLSATECCRLYLSIFSEHLARIVKLAITTISPRCKFSGYSLLEIDSSRSPLHRLMQSARCMYNLYLASRYLCMVDFSYLVQQYSDSLRDH